MQIALACVRVNEGINPNCGSRGSSIEHLCMVCIISAVLWGLLLGWSDGWKSCGLCYGHLWVLSRDWLQEEGSWQPKLNVSVLKQLSCHSATQKRWMKNTCQELWKFRAQQGTDMMNVPINVVLVIPGWTLALRHWRIIPKAWPNPWKLWKPMVSAPTLIARLGTPQPLGLNNSWLWTAYFLWKIGHEIFWNSSCLHRCPQHFCCHTGHKFMLRPGVHFCGLFANGRSKFCVTLDNANMA